jgi:dipeptidase E
MKTILLTSAGMNIKEEILKILPRPANQTKIAHIMTASNPEEDVSYVKKEVRIMKELGFDVENIDIEGKDENKLRDLLSNKDVIYVQGGNAFYLLKCTRESGFDKVVKDLIKRGVVYIGVSAGSYLACPTIETAREDKNIIGLTDLTAMNLVPFLVFAHYTEDKKERLKMVISNAKYPVKVLTDKQAILIKGNDIKLVGSGQEINL